MLEFSCSAWMARTSPSSILKLLRTCHRPACQTFSHTFLKSMKFWNRQHWCCRCFSVIFKICSTVLRPGLKPAWSSASSSSALALSRLRITQSITLLGWLIRLMVRQFLHCLRWLFCGKGMRNDCVHSFISHIFWYITVSTVGVVSPPFLSS